MVITDLLSRALVLSLVVPMIGVLLKLFLVHTEDQVLTDTDIVAFALHPLGLIGFLTVGVLYVATFLARVGLLMVIGFGAAEDRFVTYIDAFRYVLHRAGRLARLAGHVLARLFLPTATVIVAVAAAYAVLLNEHDINYYYANRPPAFWVALGVAFFSVGGLALVTLYRAADWVLAVPFLLFEGTGGAAALRESKRMTSAARWRIRRLLVAWIGLALILANSVALVIGRLGGLLLPRGRDYFVLGAAGLGLTLLLAGAANLAVRVLNGSILPLMVVGLYRELRPGGGTLDLPLAERGSLGPRAKLEAPHKGLLVAVAAAFLAAAGWGFLSPGRDDLDVEATVIAHRGSSKVAPENTMAAFEQAVEDGAEWIELDVQENAEGTVIVAHDRDFMRQARVSLRVRNATDEDLRALDVGSWFDPKFSNQRVPTLQDVLQWARGRVRIAIELKYYGHDVDLERAVVDVVEEAGMEEEIAVMSLKRAGLTKVARLRPAWRRGLISAASIGNLTRVGGDFLALNATAATRQQIRAAHRRGMEVYVWTINDPLQMWVMLSRGADGLITDRPALAREVLDLREQLSPWGHTVIWVAGETGLLRDLDMRSGIEDA